MSALVQAPRDVVARKPKHGEPCNGCGLCCMMSICDLGQDVFKREAIPGPCPALRQNKEDPTKYHCGLIADPATYAPERTTIYGAETMSMGAEILVGAGVGCDARINGEPSDRRLYVKFTAMEMIFAKEIALAEECWGVDWWNPPTE